MELTNTLRLLLVLTTTIKWVNCEYFQCSNITQSDKIISLEDACTCPNSMVYCNYDPATVGCITIDASLCSQRNVKSNERNAAQCIDPTDVDGNKVCDDGDLIITVVDPVKCFQCFRHTIDCINGYKCGAKYNYMCLNNSVLLNLCRNETGVNTPTPSASTPSTSSNAFKAGMGVGLTFILLTGLISIGLAAITSISTIKSPKSLPRKIKVIRPRSRTAY